MKFTITMKDPDGVYDCIEDAVKDSLKASGLPGDEQDALKEVRGNKIREVTGKFFEYGEYVNIEIDTDAGTATVLPSTV